MFGAKHVYSASDAERWISVEVASVTSVPSKTPQPERMTATLGVVTVAMYLAAAGEERAESRFLSDASIVALTHAEAAFALTVRPAPRS